MRPNSPRTIRTRHVLLAGIAGLAVATPAFAQNAAPQEGVGNEILVTATKREESLQKVPFSINAQTAKDIQRSGAVTLEDLSRNVAGLAVQNLGPGQSQVSVRGVSAGQVVRDQPGVKEQVGVYLDESVISLSLFTPDLDLFDLNRVETLRGPQGTLFGSGSVGGTIRYITNQPKLGKTEGTVEGGISQIDGGGLGGELKGAVNVPLGEKAAARAVGYWTHYAGFINAIGPAAGKNVNDGDRYGGRLSVLLEPTESLRITPRVVYQKVISNGFNRSEIWNLYANPDTTTVPAYTFKQNEQYLKLREKFSDETLIADLKLEGDLSDSVALTTVTSYSHRDILVSRDASALTGSVSVDLGFPAAGVQLASNLRDTTKLDTFSQEVRLASTDKGPLQWVIGAFYSNIKRTYDQRLPTPGYDAYTDATLGAGTSAAVANGFPADSPYNAHLPYSIKQYAVFGEATYHLTDRFKATAGARYYDFKEERTFKSGGLFSNDDNQSDRTKSNGVSPRFILSYEASDGITLNAEAAKGFRLGGVNDPLNAGLCTAADRALFGGFQSYKDESLWDYEVGLKAHGHGFTFNAAGFYNKISNLQVTLDAGSCSSRIVFNVAKAHSAGVEFEVGLNPVNGLNFSLSGSVMDSKFDTTLPGALTAATGIRDGNRLPSVPKFQITASGSYEFPITDGTKGFVTGSFQHVGDRYTQPADQENNPRTFVHNLPFLGAPASASTTVDLNLPSYELVNISGGVEMDPGLTVTVYVNNLLDAHALLSFDRERGGRARLGYSVSQPRTYGMSIRKTF
ncbi:MAG: TonB-dependent receptor [Sphingomonadales bacterium]|nr:TonB-dependent receptor [Sphingomonadales bacterium]